MKFTTQLFVLPLLLASSAAAAHTGHGVSGFAGGLMHPFSGADHLLAMLAVGLWAGQTGDCKGWLLPAAFMAALAAGTIAGMQHLPLPAAETGLAISVLALGLLVASPGLLGLRISVALAAAFGLLHGHAHGTEIPGSAAPAVYALGFLAASAALHLTGTGLALDARERSARLSRVLGLSIATSGMWMMAAS